MEEWNRIIDEMIEMNLLGGINIGPFSAYCEAYAQWRQSMEEGLPSKEQAKRANEMVRYATDFGMTPSSRARLGIGVKDPTIPDKLSNLMALAPKRA